MSRSIKGDILDRYIEGETFTHVCHFGMMKIRIRKRVGHQPKFSDSFAFWQTLKTLAVIVNNLNIQAKKSGP